MNDIVLALVRELPPVMGMPPEYWHAELAVRDAPLLPAHHLLTISCRRRSARSRAAC